MRYPKANERLIHAAGTAATSVAAVAAVHGLEGSLEGLTLGPAFLLLAILSAWAGSGAGIAATILSAAGLFRLGALGISAEELPRLLVFLVSGAGVSLVAAAHQGARARLERAHEVTLATEAALRRSEEKAREQTVELEAILNCVGDGVIVYDKEGRTLRSTPAADELLQISPQERLAAVKERVASQYEILDEDLRPVPLDEMVAVRAAVNGETVKGRVQRVTCPHREPRWLCMNAIPLHLDGRHVGAVLSMSDITAAKRSEEALKEADRRKDEFLGVLSHELRNPLAPISNALYILDRVEPRSEQADRAMDVLRRQVGQLSRLVDDLLDVTRITSGKVLLKKAPVDLVQVALRAVEDHRGLLSNRGLSLTVSASEPVWVHADPGRLAQVIGNLLQNAAKFTPAKGAVNVAIEVCDGAAEVRVRDSGSGIDGSLIDRVFDPFVQGKQTLARSEGGLGLGLALVKGLVELHGGSVTVKSEGLGHGAEFTVRLPVLKNPSSLGEPKTLARA